MFRKIAVLLILLLVIALSFGCVADREIPDSNGESDNGGVNDEGTPPSSNGEKVPSNGDGESSDDPDDEDDSQLIPDDEQFDKNGFPNPPEDEATKRY